MKQEQQYMLRCMELAQKGAGQTMPNPMVGAVLVHQGRIIGAGYHEQYGQAHAEVHCLESVLPEDKQWIPESTLYVNLEPCAHFGKTPACALRLIKERVKAVVIANTDPFEKVCGKGIAMLQEAGIVVKTGLLEAEGRFLNRRFFTFHEKKRPYIILKWAQSAEGFLAQADRSRCQLSNVFSSRLVHKWRTEESAIMVGFRTLMQDNPQLTARFWQGFQPLRIVLDKDLRVPEDYHVFNADAPTWIINQHRDEVQNNVRWLQLPFDTGLLNALLSKLYEAGKLSLIVEGGAVLLQHFINQGLWDEARVFHTPVSLPQGISAPVLTEAQLSCSAEVHTDTLQIFYPNHGVDSGIIYQ